MALYGQLSFYTERRPQEPTECILQIASLARPSKLNVVFRKTRESPVWKTKRRWGREVENDNIPSVNLPNVSTPKQFADEFKDGESIFAFFADAWPADRIMNSIASSIPDEIRGDFLPTDMTLSLGFQNLYSVSSDDWCDLVARPFLTIGFFGYGVPRDWKRFRQIVFGIHGVAEVRQEFEAVTGPLEQWIDWQA